jgi:hypothetical protein
MFAMQGSGAEVRRGTDEAHFLLYFGADAVFLVFVHQIKAFFIDSNQKITWKH